MRHRAETYENGRGQTSLALRCADAGLSVGNNVRAPVALLEQRQAFKIPVFWLRSRPVRTRASAKDWGGDQRENERTATRGLFSNAPFQSSRTSVCSICTSCSHLRQSQIIEEFRSWSHDRSCLENRNSGHWRQAREHSRTSIAGRASPQPSERPAHAT